ncbi:hypothetical protein BABINDRAFT_130738 [Babjeviella inositovora NRRL Y-12698]|uniref:Uncharacterized protein n=1 Tax=Babjeviella inositovora NRRL Y-12698 TaxID=984486 RepID=A0A1E3QRA9_9ASCO|nr:uncharacterized protein BABINDRAFT_130738 [Babjeviella inositovora NRRL Y-12698]ODQ80229.1 hypothetical protein BABINDRAFT_130738 [Babjeviella inositovora NRRL Y-12698]
MCLRGMVSGQLVDFLYNRTFKRSNLYPQLRKEHYTFETRLGRIGGLGVTSSPQLDAKTFDSSVTWNIYTF